jgi:uncharacterized membrane-anchored protein
MSKLKSLDKFNNKTMMKYGFVFAIFFQMTILFVEYIGSALPIWFGEPIALKTEPVDPRSLFRGNYVSLSYSINRIPKIDNVKKNDIIYVLLKKDGRIYRHSSSQLTKPKKGIFLRGRVTSTEYAVLTVKFGIEAFFMPKEKALETEKKSKGVSEVIVYVNSDGKARAHSFSCIGDDCNYKDH